MHCLQGMGFILGDVDISELERLYKLNYIYTKNILSKHKLTITRYNAVRITLVQCSAVLYFLRQYYI